MIVEPEFFLIELDSVTLPGPVAQSPIKLILDYWKILTVTY